TDAETAGLPDPVRAFFAAAIVPGTPLAPAVRLAIRGEIWLGGRWRSFRSQEVLAPRTGLVWWGRVARVVSGGDCALGERGFLDWKLFGIKTVAHADGPDILRSGLARAFAEGVLWAPTAVLPRCGVTWTALSSSEIAATASTGYDDVELRLTLDADHRVVAAVFHRWGDPDATGTPALHPFGGEVTAWGTFAGVTIASRGFVGWGYGTPQWPAGEFFRYEVTGCDLLTG
ncbi:MAG: DUF6544 family protein, partial [Acidimicrobiia bacterium]